MTRLLSCALVATLTLLPAFADSAASDDLSENPHVLFLRSWLSSDRPKGEHLAPAIRFRFSDELYEAVRNRDQALVRQLLPLYTDALASEIDLTRLELAANRQLAETARHTADQLNALVSVLSERPAGGAPGRIERETLSAAALPFEVAAAESLAKVASLQRRLELLGDSPPNPAPELSEPPAPASTNADSLAAASPVLRVLDLLAERRLASLDPVEQAAPTFTPLFITEESIPTNRVVRLGLQDRFSQRAKNGIREINRLALAEVIQRRLDVIAALQPILNAFPKENITTMAAAAELADRQYRQGAIPISLLIETQNTLFEAQKARVETLLNLWRETLELRSLAPSAPARPVQVSAPTRDQIR